jgi:hypothetical protein
MLNVQHSYCTKSGGDPFKMVLSIVLAIICLFLRLGYRECVALCACVILTAITMLFIGKKTLKRSLEKGKKSLDQYLDFNPSYI